MSFLPRAWTGEILRSAQKDETFLKDLTGQVIFEMAAMPFQCNGILVVLGNLPRIFPMFSLIYASFLIPYSNL